MRAKQGDHFYKAWASFFESSFHEGQQFQKNEGFSWLYKYRYNTIIFPKDSSIVSLKCINT